MSIFVTIFQNTHCPSYYSSFTKDTHNYLLALQTQNVHFLKYFTPIKIILEKCLGRGPVFAVSNNSFMDTQDK